MRHVDSPLATDQWCRKSGTAFYPAVCADRDRLISWSRSRASLQGQARERVVASYWRSPSNRFRSRDRRSLWRGATSADRINRTLMYGRLCESQRRFLVGHRGLPSPGNRGQGVWLNGELDEVGLNYSSMTALTSPPKTSSSIGFPIHYMRDRRPKAGQVFSDRRCTAVAWLRRFRRHLPLRKRRQPITRQCT